MDYSLISWIITGVIAFIIFCGVIMGAIRGLKKTAIRGIWLLVTAVVVYLISAVIVKSLIKIDITFLNLEGETSGSTASTINEAIAGLLNNQYGENFSQDNAELVSAILNLIPMILAPIVFTLLFWILKYFLLPLNAIIVRVCFPNAKQKYKKKLRKQRKLAKQNTLGFANNINGDEEITPIETNYHASSLENIRNNQYTPNANTKIENAQLNDYLNKINQLKQENRDIRNGKNFIQQNKVKNPQPEQTVEETPQETNNTQQIIQNDNQTNNQITKIEETQIPEMNYVPKVKKRRLLGMVVGLVISLFICCCTLVPINGIINATKEINKHKALLLDDESKHVQGYLTAITDGEYDNIINAYENSIGVKILKYTGVEATSIFGFNNLAVAKKDKLKVKLSDDIKTIMKTVDTAGRLSTVNSKTIKNYSVEDLNNLLNDVELLINNIFDIDLLNYLGTYGITLVLDIFNEEKVNEITGDKHTARILNASLNSIRSMSKDESFSFKSFEDEFIKIINIFRTLNVPEPNNSSNSLLKRIINNDFDKPLIVFYNLGENYINNVINSVFQLKLGADVLPDVTNTLMNILFESQDLTFVENELTTEAINSSITQIIDACFNVLDELNLEADNINNSLRNDSDAFKILKAIGSILDTLKETYLADESYNNGVTKLTDSVAKELEKAIPDEYSGLRTQLINMIKTANDPNISWESEMANIGNALNLLREENILTNSNSNISVKIKDLEIIGKLLDELEFIEDEEITDETSNIQPSKIFNFKVNDNGTEYNSMVKVISEVINFTKKFVNKNEDLINILDSIKTNILTAELETENILNPTNTEKELGTVNWSVEFGYINDLYTQINKIISKEIKVSSLTNIYESGIVKNLGGALNNANKSIFLKGITQKIISYGLGFAKDYVKLDGEDFTELNTELQNTLKNMQDKLDNEETVITNWEPEFNIMHELLGVACSVSSSNLKISNIPTYMKSLEFYINNEFIDNKSILIDNNILKSILSPTIKMIADKVSDDIIKTAILDIKNNLDNVTFDDTTSYLQNLTNYLDSGLLLDTNNYENAYRNLSSGITSYALNEKVDLSSSNTPILHNGNYYFSFNLSNDSTHIYAFRFNLNTTKPEIMQFEKNGLTYSTGVQIASDYVTFKNDGVVYVILSDNTSNPTIDDISIAIYSETIVDNKFNTIKENTTELKTYYGLNTTAISTLEKSILQEKANDITTNSVIIKESISGKINYYKLIGFWEKEMLAVTSLYELATEEGIELTSEIGAKLDKILNNQNPVLNSELITNQVLKNLIANKLVDLIHLDGTDSISTAVNTQIENISIQLKFTDTEDSNYISISSWENEFKGLIQLKDIDFTNVTLDSFDYEDTTVNEATSGVGKILDDLILNSNIIKFENIKEIIVEVINSKINELSTDKFGDITSNIQSKLETYNYDEYLKSNFSNEFSSIKVLIDLNEIIPDNYDEILDDDTLTSISKRLDLTKKSYITNEIGIDIMKYLVDEIKEKNQENLIKIMKDKFPTDNVENDFNQIFNTITDNLYSFGDVDDDYELFFDNMIPLKDAFVEIDNFSKIDNPTQDDIDKCNEAIDKLSNNILLEDVTEGNTQTVIDIFNKYFKI